MNNNERKEQPPHPLDSNISFLSRITFSWLFNLIALGRQRELENEDVFECPSALSSKNNVDRFDALVAKERKKKNPKFASVLWNIIWSEYCSAFLYVPSFIICYLLSIIKHTNIAVGIRWMPCHSDDREDENTESEQRKGQGKGKQKEKNHVTMPTLVKRENVMGNIHADRLANLGTRICPTIKPINA